MIVRFWPCLLVGASLMMGCGSKPAEVSKPAPAEPTAPVETPKVAETAPPTPPTPPPPPEPPKTLAPVAAKVEPPAIPDKPDDLVKLVATELSENRPQILFYALPNSYQQDLFLAIAKPASETDAEIWSTAVDAIRNVAVAMRTKKDVLLNYHAIPVFGTTKEELAKYWDPFIDLLETIANSNIRNPEDLASINLGDYLAETGSQIMQKSGPVVGGLIGTDINAELKNVVATTVSQEGDSAVVKIEVPNRDPQEVEFIRIEGKWLPQYVAQNWPAALENIKKATDMLMPKKTDDKRKRQGQMLGVTTLKSFAELVPTTDDPENIYDSLDFIFKFAKFKIPDRKKPAPPEEGQEAPAAAPGEAAPAEAAPSEPPAAETPKAEEPKSEEPKAGEQ
ncbi:MAG: hypothetical protein U1D30_22100 [Planctomycetota bacterium]